MGLELENPGFDHTVLSDFRSRLVDNGAELSGTLFAQSDGGLRVCLEPLDLPLHRRALTGLCADLNLGKPVVPGTDRRLHYEVADKQSVGWRPVPVADIVSGKTDPYNAFYAID